MITFSFLITTKDRLEALKITLQNCTYLLEREDVECIICNDGSKDATSAFIKGNYPKVQLIEHTKSKGLIASRNELLHRAKGKYAISLDDDAHIVSDKPLEIIEHYFEENAKCGVIAFRLFWGLKLPVDLYANEKVEHVQGFVGCGHVWNMRAWRDIPDYPDWFIFYGEEEFASFELFKKGWEVHYVPEILVHHKVDIYSRKKDKDYQLRLRRSLRSGWYLYILFYPWKVVPRKFIYTLWIQLKLKVFRGDAKALVAILQALFDVVWNLPRLLKNVNRLKVAEFEEFQKFPAAKLYWKSTPLNK